MAEDEPPSAVLAEKSIPFPLGNFNPLVVVSHCFVPLWYNSTAVDVPLPGQWILLSAAVVCSVQSFPTLNSCVTLFVVEVT